MSARARCRPSPRTPPSNSSAATPGQTDKVGRDVGELCGIEPLGVAATNDVDALLALKPDVVVYNPMWIDVDELVRILSAGVNVVATASFITGHNQGEGRDRIAEACQRGGSTMFGSGISPGYVNQLSIVAAGICDRVDKITVNEAADTTFYDSPATEKPVGFGQPIDDPDLQAMTAHGTGVFGEAVRMVADALGRRTRRGALRRRVRADHRGPRPRVVDHPGGLRGRRLRQLEGHRRRGDPRRDQRPVAQGADARAGLEDRAGRLGHRGRRAPDGDHEGRLPAAARLRGRPRWRSSWCSATS